MTTKQCGNCRWHGQFYANLSLQKKCSSQEKNKTIPKGQRPLLTINSDGQDCKFYVDRVTSGIAWPNTFDGVQK